MICKKHGEPRIQPINGKCYLCCQEEVIVKITYLAHNWKGEALKSSDHPFIDAPSFFLDPRDFPWLLDKTVNSEVVQVFRELLSHAYVIAIQALIYSNRPIFVNSDPTYSFKCLQVCFDNAIAFHPQNDRILWQIHYLTAAELIRRLASHEIYLAMHPKERSYGDILNSARIASHLEIGLRHLRLVRIPGSFEIKDAQEKAKEMLHACGFTEDPTKTQENIPDYEMAIWAYNLRKDYLNPLEKHFDIQGDYVIGTGSFESGPLEKFVWMIVPESARVIPEGRRKQFEMTLKALDSAMERNNQQEAEQMFNEAILFAPEESAKDRGTKMLLLYQCGVFRLRKWGYEFLSEVPANPNENEDLLRRVRDMWREALSLFLSLSPQDIRSDPHPLRDIAKKIQDDLISAGLFTPTLEKSRN